MVYAQRLQSDVFALKDNWFNPHNLVLSNSYKPRAG